MSRRTSPSPSHSHSPSRSLSPQEVEVKPYRLGLGLGISRPASITASMSVGTPTLTPTTAVRQGLRRNRKRPLSPTPPLREISPDVSVHFSPALLPSSPSEPEPEGRAKKPRRGSGTGTGTPGKKARGEKNKPTPAPASVPAAPAPVAGAAVPAPPPTRFPAKTVNGDRQCTNCGEVDTPQWRGTLCNACALWKRARGTDRPLPLLFPVRRKRSPTPDEEEEDDDDDDDVSDDDEQDAEDVEVQAQVEATEGGGEEGRDAARGFWGVRSFEGLARAAAAAAAGTGPGPGPGVGIGVDTLAGARGSIDVRERAVQAALSRQGRGGEEGDSIAANVKQDDRTPRDIKPDLSPTLRRLFYSRSPPTNANANAVHPPQALSLPGIGHVHVPVRHPETDEATASASTGASTGASARCLVCHLDPETGLGNGSALPAALGGGSRVCARCFKRVDWARLLEREQERGKPNHPPKPFRGFPPAPYAYAYEQSQARPDTIHASTATAAPAPAPTCPASNLERSLALAQGTRPSVEGRAGSVVPPKKHLSTRVAELVGGSLIRMDSTESVALSVQGHEPESQPEPEPEQDVSGRFWGRGKGRTRPTAIEEKQEARRTSDLYTQGCDPASASQGLAAAEAYERLRLQRSPANAHANANPRHSQWPQTQELEMEVQSRSFSLSPDVEDVRAMKNHLERVLGMGLGLGMVPGPPWDVSVPLGAEEGRDGEEAVVGHGGEGERPGGTGWTRGLESKEAFLARAAWMWDLMEKACEVVDKFERRQ